jgi:hypothetical protein
MKVQVGVLEGHVTVFDLEDLHLSQVIGLLVLLPIVLSLFMRPRDLKLVASLHSPLKYLKSHLPLLIRDLCIASGFLVNVLSVIVVAALVVEEVQLLQQFRGPKLAVTPDHLAARYDTPATLFLSLRKAAAFQNDLLTVALLLIEVGHDLCVSL